MNQQQRLRTIAKIYHFGIAYIYSDYFIFQITLLMMTTVI